MKYLSRLFLVAFFTATAGAAFAQCMPHDVVVQNLQKTYGETPVGLGVTPRGQQVIELFASEDGPDGRFDGRRNRVVRAAVRHIHHDRIPAAIVDPGLAAWRRAAVP